MHIINCKSKKYVCLKTILTRAEIFYFETFANGSLIEKTRTSDLVVNLLKTRNSRWQFESVQDVADEVDEFPTRKLQQLPLVLDITY